MNLENKIKKKPYIKPPSSNLKISKSSPVLRLSETTDQSLQPTNLSQPPKSPLVWTARFYNSSNVFIRLLNKLTKPSRTGQQKEATLNLLMELPGESDGERRTNFCTWFLSEKKSGRERSPSGGQGGGTRTKGKNQ